MAAGSRGCRASAPDAGRDRFNALLLSLVTGVVLIRQDSLVILRFWVAGSLSQATVRPLFELAYVAALGSLIAWAISHHLEALSLGAAFARGLGTNTGKVQAATLVAVTLTTGAAVAVAGLMLGSNIDWSGRYWRA